MIKISETINARGLKQKDAAELLLISQPRVSALLKGKIDEFRLDTLVDFAHRLRPKSTSQSLAPAPDAWNELKSPTHDGVSPNPNARERESPVVPRPIALFALRFISDWG